MGMVAPQQRIASAYFVAFGKYGDVSRYAEERCVCRQWVYREADRLRNSLASSRAQIDALGKRVRELEQQNAALEQRLTLSVELDEEKQAQLAAVGQANGVSRSFRSAAPRNHEKWAGFGYAGGGRRWRRGRFNCGASSPRVSLVPDIAAYPKLLPPFVGSTQSRLLFCSMSSPAASPGELPWTSFIAAVPAWTSTKKTVVACLRRVAE